MIEVPTEKAKKCYSGDKEYMWQQKTIILQENEKL